MRDLPEIPLEDVAEYWQLVRDALVAGGMSKKEAVAVAKAYREYMKPASWTIYNRDPEDSAEMAKSLAAWRRKEQEQAAAKPAKKRPKQRAKNADELPTEEEIGQLPQWARVAFAARCARRVEPLFQKHWPDAPEKHILAVRRAAELAEESASLAVRDLDSVFAARAAARAASDADKGSASIAVYAAYTAFSALGNRTVDAMDAALDATGQWATPIIRQDFRRVLDECRLRKWTNSTPVPPAVFGPLWPEGPPADWPALPKPTQVKLSVQVPDGMDDAAVLSKLKTLSAALARLNVAGGGHGLKLIPPIEFTQEQDKGLADVVREEGEKPKGRGHARGGR